MRSEYLPLSGILPLNSSAESVNVHGDERVVRLLLSLVREREELVSAVLLQQYSGHDLNCFIFRYKTHQEDSVGLIKISTSLQATAAKFFFLFCLFKYKVTNNKF